MYSLPVCVGLCAFAQKGIYMSDSGPRIKLPIEKSLVVVAMVQIEGPLPNGKHLSVIQGRETYAWKSLEEIEARIKKAAQILDLLHALHPGIDIVLFPEYSLPVESAIPVLQGKADAYRFVIVPGSDNITPYPDVKILNRSPVIIPGLAEPVWITKSEPSQWEVGMIDAEPDQVNPFFYWEVNGKTYCLSIRICLDLTLAGQTNPMSAIPGLYLVPMCSPDLATLRTYADVLLRAEGGSASILCNAVGKFSTGQSCVMSVTAAGERLRPALELDSAKEQVSVFEIDCDRLVMPKKSQINTKPPLGKRFHYDIDQSGASGSGIRLIPVDFSQVEKARLIGVINPAIFDHYGKKMRISFLSVQEYASLIEKAKGVSFEILAVLGHHDIMITHLHEARYDMFYDVNQIVSWRPVTALEFDYSTSRRKGEFARQPFPYFRVDTYHKVLGVPVGESLASAVDIPDEEELREIFLLGENWEDETVSDATRDKFLARRWILGKTSRRPGVISGVMAISLDYAGIDVSEPLALFDYHVLPKIVHNNEVTSVYGGTGIKIGIQYLVRMTTSTDKLFELIEEIHKLAAEARVLISTTTYVVVKKLASLSLRGSFLLVSLPPNDIFYRDQHILPHLSERMRDEFKALSEGQQRRIISYFRATFNVLKILQTPLALEDKMPNLKGKLAMGLLKEDFEELREIHDILQSRVERTLRSIINEVVSEATLDGWQSGLNIPRGKTRDKLTYAEQIKVVLEAIRAGKLDEPDRRYVEELIATTDVRNWVKHSDWDRLTMTVFCAALTRYGEFLARWIERHGAIS
jgi:hypothetical protein